MEWCFPQQSLALLPGESGVMFAGDSVCSADRLLRVAQAHGERISNDCGAGRRPARGPVCVAPSPACAHRATFGGSDNQSTGLDAFGDADLHLERVADIIGL